MRKFLIIAGALMLSAAIILFGLNQYNLRASQKQAEAYVQTISRLIPQQESSVPQERRDNTMSAISIDGKDFVGILEFPRYASALPVCNDWGSLSKYPCRFDGSIYNSSLQIGATSQKGQYDFFREISVGDAVSFTDAEGNCYLLSVSDIRYAKSADSEILRRENAALTLFIKNIYSFEYIVIFCN